MTDLNKTLQDLSADTKVYADLKADELKLKLTKDLSLSLGQAVTMLLVILSSLVVLMALAAGCVLLIGRWTGSYIAGTFIMAGVFAILSAVLYLLRKKLFVNTFVKLFARILFEKKTDV